MFDIRWLEDFLAVAETKSFTRAAEQRNITQSGLSRRIQALEHWAGMPLIDRRATPVALTPSGREVLAGAADVAQRIARLRGSLDQNKRWSRRTLSIAAPNIMSVAFLPQWLPIVETVIGEFALVVHSDLLPQCCAALEDGRADFLVCMLDRHGDVASRIVDRFAFSNDRTIKVGAETLLPLSAPDNRGAPRHSLERDKTVDFLSYSPVCILSWALQGLLAHRPDLRLRRRAENTFADGLRTLALRGMGVAWLPSSTTIDERRSGSLVRAGDPSLDIHLDIVVARPEHALSKQAEMLWDQIKASPGSFFLEDGRNDRVEKLQVLASERRVRG